MYVKAAFKLSLFFFVQIEEPSIVMHFETNLSKQMGVIFCFVMVDLHQGIK